MTILYSNNNKEFNSKINYFITHELEEFVASIQEKFEKQYSYRYKSTQYNEEYDLFSFIENHINNNCHTPFQLNSPLNNGNFNTKSNINIIRFIDDVNIFGYSEYLSQFTTKTVRSDIDYYLKYLQLSIEKCIKRYYILGKANHKWISLDKYFEKGWDFYKDLHLNDFYKFDLERNAQFYNVGDSYYMDLNGSIEIDTEYTLFKKKQFQTIFYKGQSNFTFQDYITLVFKKNTTKEFQFELFSDVPQIGNILLCQFSPRSFLKNNYNDLIDLGQSVKLIPISDAILDVNLHDDYLNSFKEVENYFRNEFNLPLIGEGWISETKLYYSIKNHFINDLVIQHAKPYWLDKQHFDIFLPKHNIAIEYQGDQHFRPITIFGGLEALSKNIERDKRKMEKAVKNNCKLIYVYPDYKLEDVLLNIEQFIKR